MNIEINTKEYFTNVDINARENGLDVTVHYVFVTVAGVSFDIVNAMPTEAWDALYEKIKEEYEKQGGKTEDLIALREKLRLTDDEVQ